MKFSAMKPDGTIQGVAHVALFDILGFKALVEAHSLHRIREIFEDGALLTKMGGMASLLGGMQHWASRFKPAPCEFTHFSDTVLIVSPDKSERGLVSILSASCSLVAAGMLQGIPLRGGVTRGEVFISKDRRFQAGPAIARAHALEKSQDWAGGVVDLNCIPTEPLRHMTTETTIELMTAAYPVPFKKASDNLYRCLNWAPFYAMSVERTLEEAMTMHIGGGGAPESRKRANTQAYYDWSITRWIDERGSLFPWHESSAPT